MVLKIADGEPLSTEVKLAGWRRDDNALLTEVTKYARQDVAERIGC